MNWWVVVLERQTDDRSLTFAAVWNADFRDPAKLRDWFVRAQQKCGAAQHSGGVQHQPVADPTLAWLLSALQLSKLVNTNRTCADAYSSGSRLMQPSHSRLRPAAPRAVAGATCPIRISGIPIDACTMRIWCSCASLWSPTCTAEPDRGSCFHQLIRPPRTINFTSGWSITRLEDRIVQLKLIRHAHYSVGITNVESWRF